jgi:hypothetical protein
MANTKFSPLSLLLGYSGVSTAALAYSSLVTLGIAFGLQHFKDGSIMKKGFG